MESICKPSMRGIFKSEISSADFFGFEQRQRAFGGGGGEDFGTARQGRQQFAAEREPVRVVVENQNFMPWFPFQNL